ncbi:protein LONGIFOLIA 1 [Senna tora]|uniref:Protein LONGIFOLIA 1 n=1 Tax=Senna tora TaxID=362788 RepID=A0A834TC34_9FABA|nr:protein LONGIFOLIA 1 [Senna tora]
MTTGIVHDQNLEKHMDKQHMGCMAGFLHIFDRHQILTGKRIHSTKRLPPSTEADSSPEHDKIGGSPASSRELEKHQPRSSPLPHPAKQSPSQSPAPEDVTPMETPAKSPLPLPVFEFKEGTRTSWKFSREAPRLSLDSRAVVDAKGSLHPREIRTNASMLGSTNRCENPGEGAENIDGDQQRRSTSVIARLMGLEPILDSDPEPVKKAELRRSASESRVSKDFSQYRFFDSNFQRKQFQQQSNSQGNNISGIGVREYSGLQVDPKEFGVRIGKKDPPKAPLRGIGPKKSFYDTADFFPEPKHSGSMYGEIEKRLKMRGIDEPSKDLETLKQILEALQLKGLLHSKKSTTRTSQRNFVFDGSVSANESPIVVMKPVRCPSSLNRPGRVGIDSPPSSLRSSPRAHRNLNIANETLPIVSPRRERPEIDRNIRSQNRVRNPTSPSSSRVKSPNRSRVVNGEAQKKMNDPIDTRRVSPVQSPKVGSRRNLPEQQQVTNRSPRMRKPTYHKEKLFSATEDESSTISESSFSMTSQSDTERYKLEEYKEGRNLLERCDKLLHSIAEITETELQPSPVSVLDSSFYKDESSPSPVMKRYIDYKDQLVESEDDVWSAAMEAKSDDTSEDCDLLYISEILRASNYFPEDSDVFLLLEKQQYLKGKDTSKVSTLQRRLIFDTIHEILNRKRQVPPWKVDLRVGETPSAERIWWELRRIRERDESEDLFEVICGVLRKDLAMNGGWLECPMEKSDAVLDVERLIFKDLVGETIRDLATISQQRNNKIAALRRKLVF